MTHSNVRDLTKCFRIIAPGASSLLSANRIEVTDARRATPPGDPERRRDDNQ